MNGVLFSVTFFNDDLKVTPYYLTFSDLPDDVEVTDIIAFEHFKVARKRYKIKGRVFVLRLQGKSFLIGPVVEKTLVNGKIKKQKAFKTFHLGDDDDGSIHAVVGQDGNDDQ